MESETPVGAWAVFHPARVKPVVWCEFAPVGHRSSFKVPSRWLAGEVGFFDVSSTISKPVTVGAVFVFFFENAEVPFGGWCAGGADGDWGDHENLRAFHHVNHLVAG